MKKLEGYATEVMNDIIIHGEFQYEVEGKRYFLSITEDPDTTVTQDLETDPTLEKHLRQAKNDISKGNVYSTSKVVMKIDKGKI